MERHLCRMAVHVGARVVIEPELGGMLVALGTPRGRGIDQGGFVRWSSDTSEARLTSFEEMMLSQGAWPALVLVEGRSRPAELAAILERRGWSQVGAEMLMWSRTPASVPHLDPLLRLEAVTVRSAAEHEDLERHIFGLPASATDGRIEGMVAGLDEGTLRAYLVRSGKEAVAVARLSLLDGMAGLAGIGVLPHRRREGLGTLVTSIASRAGLAVGRPLVWLSVDESDVVAVRLYQRLGFRPALRWQRWLAPA